MELVDIQESCKDKDTGLFFGWVCPICWKIYPTKELGLQCFQSHDELEADYVFETGERFPVEVIVYRTLGNKKIECATYTRKSIEKIGEENVGS